MLDKWAQDPHKGLPKWNPEEQRTRSSQGCKRAEAEPYSSRVADKPCTTRAEKDK
jgi:hypothetical protein